MTGLRVCCVGASTTSTTGHSTQSATPLQDLKTVWEPWLVSSNTTTWRDFGPGHMTFSTVSAVCYLFGAKLSDALADKVGWLPHNPVYGGATLGLRGAVVATQTGRTPAHRHTGTARVCVRKGQCERPPGVPHGHVICDAPLLHVHGDPRATKSRSG